MKNKIELIDKSALVAEIKVIISKLRKSCNPNPLGTLQECLTDAEIEALHLILDYIDTLEVKKVDLEKEIDKWICDDAITHEDCSISDVISTAKHFFELGLKAKGE